MGQRAKGTPTSSHIERNANAFLVIKFQCWRGRGSRPANQNSRLARDGVHSLRADMTGRCRQLQVFCNRTLRCRDLTNLGLRTRHYNCSDARMLSTARPWAADCPSAEHQACSGLFSRHATVWRLPPTCAAGGRGTLGERTGLQWTDWALECMLP